VRLAVVQQGFEGVGGGLRLVADLLTALRGLGYDFDVYSERVDPDTLAKLGLGWLKVKYMRCSKLYRFLSNMLDRTGRFVRLSTLLQVRACLDFEVGLTREYDLVIDTAADTIIPVHALYIHYPIKLDTDASSGLARRAYSYAVKALAERLRRGAHPRIILTNSTWTREKIYEAFGGGYPVEVLHPAVRVEFFGQVFSTSFSEREKLAVTISRISPEKKLEAIVDAAKMLPDYRFVIMGSAGGPHSKLAMKALKSRIEALKVDNVEVRTNVSDEEIRDMLGRARFYLHPPFAEHFGIAIAEAMAAGAIPIVYRDGGGWTDLVSPVDSMLGYGGIDQVPQIVRTLEQNPNRAEEIRQRAWRYVQQFSFEKFKARLGEILKRV